MNEAEDVLRTGIHLRSFRTDLLLEQLSLYDTYGQTGYLGMGVNHLILEKTILAVEKQFCSRR